MTDVNDVIEFLNIAASKGFLNDNTVVARRVACNKLFEILEPDQRTVEYVEENLDILKGRFTNLNKDVRGNTVEEYVRRVRIVLDDFKAWKADRASWERKTAAKQNRSASEGEKIAKAEKSKGKPEQVKQENVANGSAPPVSDARTVTFPIRPDFELAVTLPRAGITVDEVKRLVYFLLPYAKDWQPSESPRGVFPMLERESL